MNTKTKLSPSAQAAAAFLLDFGRCGFDTDDVDVETLTLLCEAWADHLMTGSERPGGGKHNPSVRDWPGAREFVRKQRLAEQDFVGRNVHDLRDLIWRVVHSLSGVATTATQIDHELTGRLERLRETDPASLAVDSH